MADISQELQAIMQAVYGEEVRGSIHDAIDKINQVGEVVLSAGTAVTSESSPTTGYYDGSLYLNKNTSDLWKCTGTAWELVTNLQGASIATIEKTGTSGLVDTYTVTLDNNVVVGTFTVTNGRDATGSTIASLDDVLLTSLGNKQILRYDSVAQKWVNADNALSDLSDTDITTPASGNILKYNGSEWENSDALSDTQAMIAPVETNPATASHAVGSQLIYNEVLYDVILAISPTDSLAVGTNIAVAESVSEKIKKIVPTGNPVGTIIAYFGATAPDGYLVCDGSYKNQADYPALAARLTSAEFNGAYGQAGTTTFQLPDLRGEFLRGTGTNSHTNQGSGANVGTHQNATNIPSFRAFKQVGGEAGNIQGFVKNNNTTVSPSNKDSNSTNIGTVVYADLAAVGTQTDAETYTARPTNTSVLYCIKY